MENQPLTFQEVEKILRIIDAAPKEGTFTIKIDDVKLSVTKGQKPQFLGTVAEYPAQPIVMSAPPAGVPAGEGAPAPQTPPAPSQAESLPAAPAVEPAASSTPVHAAEETSGHPVSAPLTGVFYRQPSPGADPFVVEGQRVEAGDVLAIIEVMKLMNRLTAPVSGVVKQILAENEQLIEHGNTLFVIDTSAGAS